MKSGEEAVDVCSEAHQREPQNIHILRDRAEAYILLQEYDKGNEMNVLNDMKIQNHNLSVYYFLVYIH